MSAAASAPPLPALGPVTSHERIETIDILRGFALLCILVVNWTTDSKWSTGSGTGWVDAPDRIAFLVANTLLNEKSWPMFAMLFGVGFAIQMERAAARGGPFLRVYARRLVILAAIGVAHNILTERDILFDWALAGFVLIPLRTLPLNLVLALAVACSLFNGTKNALNRRDANARWNNAHVAATVDPAGFGAYAGAYEFQARTPFIISVRDDTLYMTPYQGSRFRLFPTSRSDFFGRNWQREISFVRDSAGVALSLVIHTPQGDVVAKKSLMEPYIPDDAAIRRQSVQRPADLTYAHGTFVQIVSMRAKNVWSELSSWQYYKNFLFGTWVFPPFLLGLYAGRRRIFHDVGAHTRLLRHAFWWSAAFGAAVQMCHYLVGPGGSLQRDPAAPVVLMTRIFVTDIGQVALAVAYIAGLALLVESTAWKRRFAWLAPVGRMALTNYLLQSVAFVAVFFGYGLGLYGRVGAFQGTLMAFGVFALQVVASRWWIRRFRFGPAEWVWRSLTYGERQPMRAVGAVE